MPIFLGTGTNKCFNIVERVTFFLNGPLVTMPIKEGEKRNPFKRVLRPSQLARKQKALG